MHCINFCCSCETVGRFYVTANLSFKTTLNITVWHIWTIGQVLAVWVPSIYWKILIYNIYRYNIHIYRGIMINIGLLFNLSVQKTLKMLHKECECRELSNSLWAIVSYVNNKKFKWSIVHYSSHIKNIFQSKRIHLILKTSWVF